MLGLGGTLSTEDISSRNVAHTQQNAVMDILDSLQTVYTYRELQQLGMSSSVIARRIRQRELARLIPGVYTTQSNFRQLPHYQQYPYFISAVYKKNPQTVFTHQTAAWLHGFAVVDQKLVDVQCHPSSRGRAQGIAKHYSYTALDTTSAHGLFHLTTRLRTLADCCRYLHPSSALVTVESALYQGACTVEEIAEYLRGQRGRGVQKMRTVAGLMSSSSESAGESKLKWVLHMSPLPLPAQQVDVWVDNEHFRLDFAYENEMIALEFDGRVKYLDTQSRDEVFFNEVRREKLLKNAGWDVLRYDWSTVVHHPQRIVREVLATMQRKNGNSRIAALR